MYAVELEQQQLGVERLAHHFPGARLERLEALLPLGRPELVKNDRRLLREMRVVAKRATDVDTAHVGEPHIDHDQIRLRAAHETQQLAAGVRAKYGVAVRPRIVSKERAAHSCSLASRMRGGRGVRPASVMPSMDSSDTPRRPRSRCRAQRKALHVPCACARPPPNCLRFMDLENTDRLRLRAVVGRGCYICDGSVRRGDPELHHK